MQVSATRLSPGAAPLPHRNTRSTFSGTDASYVAYSSAESSASSSIAPNMRSNGQRFDISFDNVSHSTAGSSMFTRRKVFDIDYLSVVCSPMGLTIPFPLENSNSRF